MSRKCETLYIHVGFTINTLNLNLSEISNVQPQTNNIWFFTYYHTL